MKETFLRFALIFLTITATVTNAGSATGELDSRCAPYAAPAVPAPLRTFYVNASAHNDNANGLTPVPIRTPSPTLIPTATNLPTNTYYVDPDFLGASTGGAAAPWRNLDNAAWTIINSQLASSNVTVFFSARNAASDTNQVTASQLVIRRLNTSTNRLTLDGMSKYNTNYAAPSWSDYSGSSRFEIISSSPVYMALTNRTDNSYLTFQGFRVNSPGGDEHGIDVRTGSHLIIQDNFVTRSSPGGGGAGIYVNYAHNIAFAAETPCVPRNDYQTCGIVDITIQNNTVEKSPGEGMYIGGSDNANLPGNDGILIENNIVRDSGQGVGEGDAIDIKDGNANVVIRGNTIYMTTPDTGRGVSGVVSMSWALTENNFIYNMDGAGIVLTTFWNAYAGFPRNSSIIRNNVIVRCGSASRNQFNYGIVLSGKSTGDQFTNVQIFNNSIYDIQGSPGIGIGIDNYSSGAKVKNNAVYKTVGLPLSANTGGLDAANHDYNIFSKTGGGAVAAEGGNNYTAVQITSFEAHSKSQDPKFINTNTPYTSANFNLQSGAPGIDAGATIGNFNTDKDGVTRPQGSAWDIGAYEVGGTGGDTTPPSALKNLRVR